MLLVSQGHDGVVSGSAKCRIKRARRCSNQRKDYGGKYPCRGDENCKAGIHLFQDDARQKSQANAKASAKKSENKSLRKEHANDVKTGKAQGLQDANLARALHN